MTLLCRRQLSNWLQWEYLNSIETWAFVIIAYLSKKGLIEDIQSEGIFYDCWWWHHWEIEEFTNLWGVIHIPTAISTNWPHCISLLKVKEEFHILLSYRFGGWNQKFCFKATRKEHYQNNSLIILAPWKSSYLKVSPAPNGFHQPLHKIHFSSFTLWLHSCSLIYSKLLLYKHPLSHCFLWNLSLLCSLWSPLSKIAKTISFPMQCFVTYSITPIILILVHMVITAWLCSNCKLVNLSCCQCFYPSNTAPTSFLTRNMLLFVTFQALAFSNHATWQLRCLCLVIADFPCYGMLPFGNNGSLMPQIHWPFAWIYQHSHPIILNWSLLSLCNIINFHNLSWKWTISMVLDNKNWSDVYFLPWNTFYVTICSILGKRVKSFVW